MDPSGLFGVDQASGQSSQTKDNIGMEPVYYNAAAKIEIGEPAQAEVNIGMKADYYKRCSKWYNRGLQRYSRAS
ncbi:hypothetical protein CFP56_024238 [Quercus suber]|uniref:Uncharacterized protein n=1 Tax=Quercus suber TaxID=58331 RepID=A0AAW0MDK5_QUESU